MGEVNIELKFPCGYEIKVKYKSLFLSWDGDMKGHGECPLHGKNCKGVLKR